MISNWLNNNPSVTFIDPVKQFEQGGKSLT